MMLKAKKKPIIIEYVQYNGSVDTIPKDCLHFFIGDVLYIRTLEGNMRCNINDYIIKGIKGEFYSIQKNIFEESYDLIEG